LTPGGLEEATPSGTCPPPGSFAAAAAIGCWFCMHDLQSLYDTLKAGLLVFLELSSSRIP